MPKSPVKMSVAIVGIILTLSIGGFLARESLLVGMLKVGFHTENQEIVQLAAVRLEKVGGKEIWWKLEDSPDSEIAEFATTMVLTWKIIQGQPQPPPRTGPQISREFID